MAIDFEIFGDEGVFQYSGEPFHRIVDELDEALDQRESGRLSDNAYVATLETLVARAPEFIDGHAHLGFALLERGKTQKALDACLHGVAIAERSIPEDFDGRIEWGHLDNRPFLRAMHGAVVCQVRLRRRQAAVALMEKMLAYNPNDNQGIRYLLGSEYLRLGKRDEARRLLEREAEHYPPYHYELALLHMLDGNWVTAATCLRRGFCANSYIAEILCGNPNPAPLAISHGSNFSEPGLAREYASMYGEFWRHKPDCITFVRWLFNHPRILAERAALLECQQELLWEHDFERRGPIVDRMHSILDGIDEQISEQIVQRRLDRNGRSVWPWL